MRYEHFEREIPDKLSRLAGELYGSFYSVKEHFRIFRGLKAVNTLVIYENEKPRHVIFYVLSGRQAIVLSEFFEIEDKYSNYFADFIFDRYGEITTIHFSKTFTEPGEIDRPHLTWSISNDIVLDLPASVDEYHVILGKKTRKTIRNYGNRLKRDFDDFSFIIREKEEIDPAVISRISELNRLRMRSLKITSAVDREFERNTIEFAMHYGIVGHIEVGGKVVAGGVCYEVGSHSFGEIIAYDQAFMEYRIALICAYSIITAMIERGSRVFHMAPGESDYKYRLGGTRRPVYTTSLFRNRLSKGTGMIRNLNRHHYIRRARNAVRYKIIEKVKHTLFAPS